jgi:Mn-dependent DtxR family transcriptional regulator
VPVTEYVDFRYRETAERDACRIEHVISEEAFEKLKTSVEKKY